MGIENPRVGLLSVGEEAAKGNRQVQESYQLFSDSHLNFIGNVEGMDFFTNKAEVIVCDGFVGNILIKFTEGLGGALAAYLHENLSKVVDEATVRQLAADLWETTNRPRAGGRRPVVRSERPGHSRPRFVPGRWSRRGSAHRRPVRRVGVERHNA